MNTSDEQIQALLAGVPGIQRSPDAWRFTCPINSEHGSAAYWPGEAGISCDGGCTTDEIVAQLDSGAAQVTRQGGSIVESIPFAELDGGPPECSKVHGFGYDRGQCLECVTRRAWVSDMSRRSVIELTADALADEWSGQTGDLFNPADPEPVPCVLEISTGRFVFAPGVYVLFGARSSAKTWLVYFAGVQELARGNRVLLLDFEMAFEESMSRMHTIGAFRSTLQRLVYVQPSGLPGEAAKRNLLARFGDTPPSLVIIDSTGMGMAAAGLEENNGTATAQFNLALPKWLKKQWPDAVILLVDHLPKGVTDGTDPIGSQRKGSIADGLYLVKLMSKISRKTRGWGRVFVHKDRRGWSDEGSDVLDFEFGGGGPFVVRPPDPERLPLAVEGLAEAEDKLVQIARYVGEHEGTKVTAARTALKMNSNEFTRAKGVLVAAHALRHEDRLGLFKGERWDSWMSANAR